MRPIRTYLLIHSDLSWESSVHRDLESLNEAWSPYLGRNDVTGVIHVGLDRPDTNEFNDIVSKYPGRMILTASARWALLGVCSCASNEVGKAEAIPLYLALNGWGYEVTLEELGFVEDKKQDSQNSENTSILLRSVVDLNLPIRAANCLRAAEIFLIGDLVKCTESDLQKLPNFGKKTMHDINGALERFNLSPIQFYDVHAQTSIYDETLSSTHNLTIHSIEDLSASVGVVNFVPEWLHPLKLNEIGLKVRTLGALQNAGLFTIADIVNRTSDFFFKIPRFGTNSLVDLVEQVRLAVDLYQPIEGDSKDNSKLFSDNSIEKRSKFRGVDELTSVILCACSSLKPHIEKIVKARMGIGTHQMTLQEIGSVMGVSRERIRQLESKGMKQIGSDSVWTLCLEKKLAQILDERDSPLPFSGLPILDNWFNGIDKIKDAFEYLLNSKYILDSKFSLVQVNGLLFVSRISQDEWDSKVKLAMQLLEECVANRLRISEARRQVDELLISKGRELRSELWVSATRFVHFSSATDNQEPVLLSYGRSAEALVSAVLIDSERPLHYSELPTLIKERYGRDIDARRANNAAAEVAINYGKGSYGLLKHCPLNSQEREVCLNEVLNIISNSPNDRQWSCDELVDQLNYRDIDFDGRLNKYSLNIALMESSELESVGRLIWTNSAASSGENLKRIDISQAVRALLEKTGRPMSNAEIKAEIKKERGVSRNFQIFPNEFVIAISAGVWGLVDRDLELNPDEQNQLRVAVEEILRERNSGVHISEISSALISIFEPASRINDPVGIFAIALRSNLFKKAPGDYLYLSEWGEPRRKRKAQIVLELLTEAGSYGISTGEIVKKLSAILGRQVPQEIIYVDINAAGARFDQALKRWVLVNSEDNSGEYEQ